MMAEMLAAILAISLAMAALGGVTSLAAMSQRSNQSAQDRLRVEHRLETLLNIAAGQATPAGGSGRTMVAAAQFSYACGAAGEGTCLLSAEPGRVVLRRDGQVVASTAAPPGALRFRTVLAPGPVDQPQRLAGPIFLAKPDAGPGGLLVVSDARPDAPVDCAYDPEGFACRLPPRSVADPRP
jgi:hypothetical protein